MSKPNIIVRGLHGKIPSGYVIGRTEPGDGPAHLIDLKKLGTKLVGSGTVASPAMIANTTTTVISGSGSGGTSRPGFDGSDGEEGLPSLMPLGGYIQLSAAFTVDALGQMISSSSLMQLISPAGAATNAKFRINNLYAAGSSLVQFENASTLYWQAGCYGSGLSYDFTIYDQVGGVNVVSIAPNGNMTFAPKGGTTGVVGALNVSGNVTGGALATTGAIYCGAVAVASLPAAATVPYARLFVTDGSVVAAGNFGTVVAGGGANVVPVYSDGTNWRIG